MNTETRDLFELLDDLVKLHGPPGIEQEVAAYVADYWRTLGLTVNEDDVGNVFVEVPCKNAVYGQRTVLITAHMDEVAMVVSGIDSDGLLRVDGLGGVTPARLGEGPVDILAARGVLKGVLSRGTEGSNDQVGSAPAPLRPADWHTIRVFTGLTTSELGYSGVFPGTRVCISRSRKGLLTIGDYVASYALDDRAFLAVLLVLTSLLIREPPEFPIILAATVGEEVGAYGARYLSQTITPLITVALDVLPLTSEGVESLDGYPGIWVVDSRYNYDMREIQRLRVCFGQLGLMPHYAYERHGATDASFLASEGLTARAVAVGVPVGNSHGYEIIHKHALSKLADLVMRYLTLLGKETRLWNASRDLAE